MAVALTRLSLWLLGGKEHDPSTSTSTSSSFDFGLGFPNSTGRGMRRIKRKWQSREERRGVDKEYDIVIVPSDGGCLSGSDSDASDWSIGWMEPHSEDFHTDADNDKDKEEDSEASFAVLVPCYGRRRPANTQNDIFATIPIPDGDESAQYVEEFLSSLQNT